MALDVQQISGDATSALSFLDGSIEPLIKSDKALLIQKALDALSGIPNVHVLIPPDTAWESAVRNQVLVLGAGHRKDGVKTGAADTASVHAIQHRQADPTQYVIHGVDSDWTDVYKAEGWGVPRFVSDFKDLFVTNPKDVDSAYTVLEAMREDIDSLTYVLSGGDAIAWLRESNYSEILDASLEISVDAITKLQDVVADEGENLVWAKVFFEGYADATIQRWDPMDETWETTSTGGYTVTGEVEVAFTPEPDEKISASRWEIISDPVLRDIDGHDLEMHW